MDIIDMINLDNRDCLERWNQLADKRAHTPQEEWSEHFDSLVRTFSLELSAQKSVVWDRYLLHPDLSGQARILAHLYDQLVSKLRGLSNERVSGEEFEDLHDLACEIVERDTLFLEELARSVPRLFRGQLVNEYESCCQDEYLPEELL